MMTTDNEPIIADAELGPIAWTRGSLSPDDGVVPLSDACLGELDAAVKTLKDNPMPTLAVRPEYFDLLACQATVADARKMLQHGVGFVILDRLPMDRYSREEAEPLYWLLTSMIGRPVAQKWDGKMIYDVHDSGKKPGHGVRPDITNVEQNFHTDNSYNLSPPDYVCLLCLQTAKEGGVSGIVSFPAAHNEMRKRHPDLLPRLYQPYIFDRQREHAPGAPKILRHPIFESVDGKLMGRLSRFQVMNGYKLANETMDSEGAAALDALESIMNDPNMRKDFHFEPGQIQIVDNRRCGHKRTAFLDHPELKRRRRLIRLWLRESGRPFYNG
jgi:alpha-ketoglutarate-dependent taurine dioxygenase